MTEFFKDPDTGMSVSSIGSPEHFQVDSSDSKTIDETNVASEALQKIINADPKRIAE